MMVIGRASSADLAAVLEILDGAARWLHQQGIDQWPTGLPSLSPDRIAAQIQRGETYLISEDCAPIATIAVSAAGDPDYWTAAELAEPAVYISKTNPRLETYYRAQGWTYVRTADASHRRGGVLFQRAATPDPEARAALSRQ